MRPILVIACAGLGCSAPSTTQDASMVASVFTEVALPPGATATSIASAMDGTLFVTIDDARVLRSTTNGTSWSECGSVQGRDVGTLIVGPGGVVYFGGDSGVFTSVDSCTTWQALGAQSASSLAVFGSGLLAGANDGVLQWNEATWSRLATPMDDHPIRDLEVDTGSSRIFVASDNGIARSTDGGTSWALVNTGLGGVDAQWVVLDPVRPQRVFAQSSNELYRSIDGGTTWSAATSPGWTAAIDPSSPDFVLQSRWDIGLDISLDGGVSFSGTDRRSPGMDLGAVVRVVFPPNSQVFAATHRGVFVAPDHNLAWTEADGGIAGWTINNITVADNNVLYLGTPAGVLRSDDGGTSWTDETMGLQTDSSTAGLVQLPGTPTTIVAGGNLGISKSIDQGGTFTSLWFAGGADNYHANKVHIVGGRLVAATWGGIVTSDAAWTTFTHHDVVGQGRYIDDVVALDVAGMQLLAISNSGLFYSSDGGTSFVPADMGLDRRVYRVAILSDGTLLAGTDQGAFRATTPTGPWNPSGLEAAAIADLLVASGRVIAATDLGVFVSTDGATWAFVPGVERKNASALAVDRAGRLLVGTTAYGLYATTLP